MVPELPPAPAALVLVGLAFLMLSLWSAAARRRRADLGPPGGERGREMEEPVPDAVEVRAGLALEGEVSGPESAPEACGEDYVFAIECK